MFLFDLFLICNFLKITCSIPMEDFSLNFQVFILIAICLVYIKNKTFVVTVQNFCPKGSYWIIVHFILFAIRITFLLVKVLFSMVLKSASFIVSLFCTIFKYIIITFLFLTFEHERLLENHLSVNRPFMKISYQNNIFNTFLTILTILTFLVIFNSSGDFKFCLKALFRPLIWHSMIRILPRGAFEQTFIFSLILLSSVIWIVQQ